MKLQGHTVTDLNALLRRTFAPDKVMPTGFKCAVSFEYSDHQDKVSDDGLYRLAFRFVASPIKFEKEMVKQGMYEPLQFSRMMETNKLCWSMATMGQKVDPHAPIDRKRPVVPKTAMVIWKFEDRPFAGRIWVKDFATDLVFNQPLTETQANTDVCGWSRIKGTNETNVIE